MLGHNVGDTVWYRPEVNTLWWLMVALIASYYHVSAQEQGQREDKEMGDREKPHG